MRILRAADHVAMPWKNGGGTTGEIAVFPQDADLDRFVWRVSTALVERGGPFSTFPGIDRTLAILSGAGLRMSVEGLGTFTVGGSDEPVSFPGDARTLAELVDGPIRDLNVMTRRGQATHGMSRLIVENRLDMVTAAATTLLYLNTGALSVAANDVPADLEAGDVLLIEGEGSRVLLQPTAASVVFVINIHGL